METLYYVKISEEELGPLTFAQLRSMWSLGEITVKTPFRCEQETYWEPLAILKKELEAKVPTSSTSARGYGCIVLLLLGIIALVFFNRGSSAEQEAAAAKRKVASEALISAMLRQDLANAKTPKEKQLVLEKLLKHEPSNLSFQTELQNIKSQSLKDELSLSETVASRKVEILNELIVLEPNDKNWQAQLPEVKKAADREAAIKKQFSPFDNVHFELAQTVMAGMNDPDSFKHVTTRYWDMKTHLVISMTFRGSNAFGGIITKTVKAKSPIEGGRIEIMEGY
jgi:hypothetical protein